VRELRNVIERAMNDAWFEMLTTSHFKQYFRHKHFKPSTRPADELRTLQQVKEIAERKAVLIALEATKMNITQAANILGISRAMLHRKMKKFDLQ
jgi:transcriptional regulator with PAS, ATPase and Fis domain